MERRLERKGKRWTLAAVLVLCAGCSGVARSPSAAEEPSIRSGVPVRKAALWEPNEQVVLPKDRDAALSPGATSSRPECADNPWEPLGALVEGCCPKDAEYDARESRCRADESRTSPRFGQWDWERMAKRLLGVARDPAALIRHADRALEPRVLRLRPRSVEVIRRQLSSAKELWSRSIRCSADWGKLALVLADGHVEYYFAASPAPGQDDRLLEQALTWYEKSLTVSCGEEPQLSPENLEYARYFSAQALLLLGRSSEAIRSLKALCAVRRPSSSWHAYARVRLQLLGREPDEVGCSPALDTSPWALFTLLCKAHDQLGEGDPADLPLNAAVRLLSQRSDQVGTEWILRR